MNTVIYLRKSRADDDACTVEDTLRKHKEILLDFASRQPDMNIIRIYEDVVSGDKLYVRPQMLRLLSDAESGEFDSVLCMDIDRLGRGAASEQGLILETFKNNDIKIITPRQVFDLNNDLDEDYAEYKSFFARQELKMIKRRMRNGTIKSVNDGCCLWTAPYGYRNATVNKRCTLEINEDEAKFVRMAFDLYVNDGMGAQTIAYTLNSLGARPHRSDHFNRTSVVAMLRNQTYIGKIVYNKKSTVRKGAQGNEKHITIYHSPDKWTVVDGLHEPIIDEETFKRAGEILSSRYHKPFNDGTVVNPLAGILTCAKCGYGMQRRPFNNKKNTTVHLLCQTKNCCKSSRLDYVEEAVLDSVRQKLEELRALKTKKRKTVDYSAAIKEVERETAQLKKQKSSLHDLLERGVYDVDTFTERSKNISDRIKTLEAEYKDLTDKQKSASLLTLTETIEKYENVLRLYGTSTPAQKNKLLKSIIDSASYLKEKDWKPKQFALQINYKDV